MGHRKARTDRSRRRTAALTAGAALFSMSGCGTAAATAAPTSTATAARSLAASPSPSPTATPTSAGAAAVRVVTSGGTATDNGTMVLVVVTNGGPAPASNVEVTATVSGGGVRQSAKARLPWLAPGETQGVAITVPLPPGTLPDDFSAAISGSAPATGTAVSTPVTVTGAEFVGTAVEAHVRVHLAGTLDGHPVTLTAICFDARGAVTGGGAVRAPVAAGVDVPVNIPNEPARCSAYSRPD
jgi:hypothetical protein